MRSRVRQRFAVAALLGLAAPLFGLQEVPEAQRRAAILETAQRFTTVRWWAEERHVLHGDDDSGVRVDTPDVALDPSGWKPGRENVGMPYCWGGFTSLENLEAELAEERYAGHVPNRGNAMGSVQTLGVDCSGLVSRCWNLPLKQSTRSLGALSYELEDYGQLLPGDIVNRFDVHVAIFTGWADDEREVMNVIETARLKVESSTYTLEELRTKGFRPMRYKLLDERWRPMPIPDAQRDTVFVSGARRRFVVEEAGPRGADPFPAALRAGGVRPGDWAHYDTTQGSLTGAGVTCTWMAAGTTSGRLELQRRLDAGADSLATGATLRVDAPWPELLAAFGHFYRTLRDFEVITSAVDSGSYRVGERELPARRVSALIEGRMLARSTLYPVVLEIECVLSDEVPLFGICEADLKLEIDYGTRGEDQVVGRQEHRYTLTAFGRE